MKKLFAMALLASTLCSCGLSSTKAGFTALASDVVYTNEAVHIDGLNLAKGAKEGRACGQNILYIYAMGDMTVEAAKRDGGITNVTGISTEVKNMIIMSKVCTVVRGY